VQFYVDQDTVYVVDAKIEVISLRHVQLLIMTHYNAGALWPTGPARRVGTR